MKYQLYIFFRAEGWYPISLPYELPNKTEKDIILDNVRCNEGTIRVENIFGKVLWEEHLMS